METIAYKELMIQASGEYLTEKLPSNYDTISDEEFENYIKEHVWEPCEKYDASEIFDMIDSSARSLQGFLENKGIEIQK